MSIRSPEYKHPRQAGQGPILIRKQDFEGFREEKIYVSRKLPTKGALEGLDKEKKV
jgi:hypothetical protein